jgi:ABC-type oligopeptide transport system substrate-binding subunit
MREAGIEGDPEKGLRLFLDADRILVQEAAILPLTHDYWPFLVKPWLKVQPSYFGAWSLRDAIIGPH